MEVNKHGLLQSKGLPTCQLSQLQPASTERALASCGDALIGSGQFWAHIVLPDQGAYPTHGRLLIFNGRQKGRPVIFTHIFTANPFFSSFVIPFSIPKKANGAYGTKLTASLPQALGRLGLRRSDQADPEAQIRLQGKATLLLQRRLSCSGGVQADRLPAGACLLCLCRRDRDLGQG